MKPPSLFRPKTESLRVMSPLWHVGQATVVEGPWTYLSKSCPQPRRSEEHTSELQSRGQLVCRLLLEKKKQALEFITPANASLCAPSSPRDKRIPFKLA